jgi:hypothetical protein
VLWDRPVPSMSLAPPPRLDLESRRIYNEHNAWWAARRCGRKPGSQDKATIEKTIRVQQGIAAALDGGLIPLDVIMAVMRGEPLSNGMEPTGRQYMAAVAAAPFLHAKLSAVVMKDVSDAAPRPPPMLSVADIVSMARKPAPAVIEATVTETPEEAKSPDPI